MYIFYFRRVDGATASHLDSHGIDFLQFAFRWVNCLLLRELPFSLAFRLWDTYLAEGSNFREFLVRSSPHTNDVHLVSLGLHLFQLFAPLV